MPRHRPLGLWKRLDRPRTFVLSPVRWGLAAAAALVLVVGGVSLRRVAIGDSTASGEARPVQFTLVAPEAHKVSVVGDFNGWDAAHAAFQARNAGGGVWTVTARVPAGYHRFAFVLNDSVWMADPNAPRIAGANGAKSAMVVGENGQ